MKLQLTRRHVLMTGAAGAASLAVPAFAESHAAEPMTHEVQMLNVHPEDRKLRQVFLPRLQVVNAGDTVKFVSTDRGHNCASMDDMIPADAAEWDGKINDDIEVTFDMPGVYGYKCTPHVASGMVGVVVVRGADETETLANLEDVQGVRQRGKAKKVFEEIWEELAEMDVMAAAEEEESA